MEEVILVDGDDHFLGTINKNKAHKSGALHRSFSIFLVNDAGDFLLQQRSLAKNHSAGLWTNTCSGHPRPKETLLAAGIRRLDEEMGIAASLNQLYHFTYRIEFDNGLIEHELNHVFLGRFNNEPKTNKEEVSDWKYMATEDLIQDLELHPETYSEWFKLSYEIVIVNSFIQ